MTVVFLHGVPNTATVWDPVRSLLSGRDTVALRLPGFGRGAPAGFSGTRYAYRDWVINELEEMEGPVDLVGHDQGSVIGQGVILARPDLINSWVLGGVSARTTSSGISRHGSGRTPGWASDGAITSSAST